MQSLLVYIASSSNTTLHYLDIETASALAAFTIKKCSISFLEIMIYIHRHNHFFYNNVKIFIADKKLFLLILFNAIRKYDESIKSNDNFISNLSETIIEDSFEYLNVKKRHTSLLLKTLAYILKKKEHISQSLSNKIIFQMRKVALSPLFGFKKYAHTISKTVLPFCSNNIEEYYSICLIPITGIDTMDLVNIYSEKYIKKNKTIFLRKIVNLFKNNFENKDGEYLYDKLIQFYPFEQWKEEIWPYFEINLKNIDHTGYKNYVNQLF